MLNHLSVYVSLVYMLLDFSGNTSTISVDLNVLWGKSAASMFNNREHGNKISCKIIHNPSHSKFTITTSTSHVWWWTTTERAMMMISCRAENRLTSLRSNSKFLFYIFFLCSNHRCNRVEILYRTKLTFTGRIQWAIGLECEESHVER